MKKVLSAILITIVIAPIIAFSQDPSCEYIISLKSVNDSVYSYKFIIEDDFNKQSLDSIREYVKKGMNNWNETENAILESDKNQKLIIGHQSDYCYPNGKKNQLRIIVARQNKIDNHVELMYSYATVQPFTTEILIPSFKEGERKTEIFTYKQRYPKDRPKKYEYKEYRIFHKRLILFK